jgi:imidazolonepropionase-like amidohydrolase
MRVALVGGKVVDGSGNPALRDGTVVIEGSKIAEVSQLREFGSDVHIVDVAGKTVMPGLIDCHQHFGGWFQFLISNQTRSLMYLASRTVDFLRNTLESGVTTARDMGGLEAGFRDAVADTLIPGPRLKVALTAIMPTNAFEMLPGVGGLISPQELYARLPGVPANFCDGPDQARAKVREVLRNGADVIKIMNDCFPDPRLRVGRSPFTDAELEAIVDEAHRAGVPVCAHAYYHDQVMAVLRAGGDSIEESWWLDEECVAEMAKRGVWYVPCMSNPRWQASHSSDAKNREISERGVEGNRRSFILALEAGVPIAMGTDSPFYAGHTALELGWMVEAGMSCADAIAASTGRAAKFLGLQDQVGTLKPGLEADLLVIDGDPLEDIQVLADMERLGIVMQGGTAVSGTMLDRFPRRPSQLPREIMAG